MKQSINDGKEIWNLFINARDVVLALLFEFTASAWLKIRGTEYTR